MPKVLIVDDSLSVRRALERVLSAKDFEVVAARSGEEALERFAAVSPDLTIADVIMPGIGGFELCRKLRERSPETPVILISGVGDAQIEQQARAVGAAAIIPKPFSPEDLSAALGAALNPPDQLSEPETSEPEPLEPEPEAATSTEPPDADSDAELLDADPPVPDNDLQSDLQSVEAQPDPQDFDLQSGSQGLDSQEPDPQNAELQDSDVQESDLQDSDLQSDLQEPEPQELDLQPDSQDSDQQDFDQRDFDSQDADWQDFVPQESEPQESDSQGSGLQSDSQAADSEGDNSPDAELQVELQDTSPVEPVLEPMPIEYVLPEATPAEHAPPVPAPQEPDTQTPTKPDLTASLNRFLEKPEVLAATLSDRQGTRLVHVGEYPSDAEALANYSRFLLVASDVLGTHYGADPTNGMVLEFPRYALYLGRIDADHILSLHLSDAKALSVVRYLMNRTLPELALELRELQA